MKSSDALSTATYNAGHSNNAVNREHTDSELIGYVNSLETLATLDGPGLRTVVFMQGCALSCKYCHNIDCSKPKTGQQYTPEQLVKELLKNKPYWEQGANSWRANITRPAETNATKSVMGGVTFSGGEPTLQSKFIMATANLLKQENVHLTIDSCLYTNEQVIDQLLTVFDYWMISLKQLNDDKHHFLTGVSNELILHNLPYLDNKLAELGKKSLRIRIVILPGYTDSMEYAERLVQYLLGYKSLDMVELLPYTSIGKQKWITLYGKYNLEEMPEPSLDQVQRFAEKFIRAGLPVKY